MYVYMYSVIKRLQMFIIHMYVRMDPHAIAYIVTIHSA